MRKSRPHRIDPAFPQKNFVEAAAINHGADPFETIHGPYDMDPKPAHYRPKHNVHGHSIGQRAGKLRYSGNKNAHRIGKR